MKGESTTKDIQFERIKQAIVYMQDHFLSQPSLEEVAQHVAMSPSHFQRIFTEWAGVSPKKFLQFISINHAKAKLKIEQKTLFDVADDTGLSSTSRLHDLFVTIEGMTPAEYKNGGKNLIINYSLYESHFGKILIASTSKGICTIAFEQLKDSALEELKMRFPNACLKNVQDDFQLNAIRCFTGDWTQLETIKIHLKGTDFQLKVWEALLQIPEAELSTYGKLAAAIGSPTASRAVGTAIGANPIAFLIPCHRVIQSTGIFGGYRWGKNRKTAIIGWEAAQAAKVE